MEQASIGGILDSESVDAKVQEPLLAAGTVDKGRAYEVTKRAIDIICSLIALIVLSPVFLITAAAVFLEDGHRPIFSQVRIGKNGKPFRMYKFRSMYPDAERDRKELEEMNEADGPVFKIENDPRITKIGHIIRKISVDELPQLWNILKGEMSIVGPRPALRNEVRLYSEYDRQRLLVKPGLTCYWQCSGRSDIGFDEWMKLDVKYIAERSTWVDIKLIFKTIPAVIMRKGAK